MTYTLFEYCRDNIDDLIPDEELNENELPNDTPPTIVETPAASTKQTNDPVSAIM